MFELIKKIIPIPILNTLKPFYLISRRLFRSINNEITECHAKKNWLSPAKISSYRKTIKIYDIFLFFNELDLLEIRLNILDQYVDYFVIVEATETFTGLNKKLYYKENISRFKKWQNKIIHYIIEDTPKNEDDLKERFYKNTSLSDLDKQIITSTLTSNNIDQKASHWLREFYQKETIKKTLTHLSPLDICYISDLDEIWNPELLIDYTKDDVFKLRQNVYSYYLNNRSNEPWAGAFVTKYKNISNGCINYFGIKKNTPYTYIKNGGWHFTNMGGADKIKKKLESYGHQEYNNDKIKSKIEENILKNKDFMGRDFKFWIDEKRLPKYLRENKEKYKEFFRK